MTNQRTPLERRGYPTAVLDTHEAAAYLAVDEKTVYKLVREGALPHTRVSRSLRFRLVDLDAYLERQTSTTWKRVDLRGRPAKGTKR